MAKQKNFETMKMTAELRQQYENIALESIKWEGLPDNLPPYLPERWLYRQGQCVVFKLPGTEDIAILPVAYGSMKLDIYGNPMEWKAFAVGSSPAVDTINHMRLNNDNSVLIWNNQMRSGDAYYISEIVKKMVRLDDTIDINCMVQRTPYIMKTNQQNQLTAKNVYKSITDGEPAVFDAGFEVGTSVDILNVAVPFIGAELSDQYETYHDRILRYLGIDYLPVEKQERMLTGEADSNEQELLIRRKTRLKYRQYAVDKINEMFGLNVSVEYEQPEPDTNTSAMQGTLGDKGEDGESGEDGTGNKA